MAALHSQTVVVGAFEWDSAKDFSNQTKHGVSLHTAMEAFSDPQAIVLSDEIHSTPAEIRQFLVGQAGGRVPTVRYTYRRGRVRLLGAGYWRKFLKLYHASH